MITYTLNDFGLRKKDMDYMTDLFAARPEIEKVIIYGSRATGHHRHGSDVDLALVGKEVDFDTISQVQTNLNEDGPTLLFFEVLGYDKLTNEKLKSEIDNDGICLYQRE